MPQGRGPGANGLENKGNINPVSLEVKNKLVQEDAASNIFQLSLLSVSHRFIVRTTRLGFDGGPAKHLFLAKIFAIQSKVER